MGKLALLAEQTAYERYVLRSATPLVKGVIGSVDLRRDPRGDVSGIAAGVEPCREVLDQFKLKFVPLMFGAAWKILDLIVEDSLGPLAARPNGRPRHWRIEDKATEVLTSSGAIKARKPFTRRQAEWTAAMRMYANTKELRHAVTHRDAGRDANGNLDIEVTDNQGDTRRHVMSLDEQLAFCRATRRLIDAILTKQLHARNRDDLAFHLAQARQYSLATFDGRDLCAIREIIVNLPEVAPGVARVDVPAAKAAIKGQPEPHVADLVAFVPGLSAPLVGALEKMPAVVREFSIVNPPRWLSHVPRVRTITE
jgi:hypothetical protein